jgi:hypothetical protein
MRPPLVVSVLRGDPGWRGLLAAGLLLGLALVAPALAGTVPAAAPLSLEKGVKASLILARQDARGLYAVRVTLRRGGDLYQFETTVEGRTAVMALAAQQANIRWRGRYLLVGDARVGRRGSRGPLDLVFVLEGGRLRYAGEVGADSFVGGAFRDLYHRFAVNALTSPARPPAFPVVVEVRGSRRRVKAQSTWQENQKAFRENHETVRYVMQKAIPPASSADLRDLTDALVFNAVLARYCEREELEAVLRTAAGAMDDQDLDRLHTILAGVVPGELPKPEVKVVYRRETTSSPTR